MSIQDFVYKIKRGLETSNFVPIYIFIVVIVGLSSFGLGRLSVSDRPYEDSLKGESINTIEAKSIKNSLNSKAKTLSQDTVISSSGNYVASKNGKLYYTASCKGVNRIKEENRVWFDTASDAEKSGYSRASSCK